MADEKNQGSQQAPRKKKSKREREREKEKKKGRKKERKERKKEGHEMETTRTTSTETDNGQGASDEHPVRRKHPERTTATKKEVSKQVENKQRPRAQKQMGHKESPFPKATKTKNTEQWINKGDKHRNRWKTRRTLRPKRTQRKE